MPSPFPGMNPFLESDDAWFDFRKSFLIHARDELALQLGAAYLVKVEVRLIVHDRPTDTNQFIGGADIGVSDHRAQFPSSAAAVIDAPMSLLLPAVETERHASLEIRDRRNRRVVTVIERLSPSNKTSGDDRENYLAKRRQILAEQTHLVEIDLRRGGQRPDPPAIPRCDYYALVSRYEERPKVGLWPVALRDPLPEIPVPLDSPDLPARLNLKAILDQTYDLAGYANYIYTDQPDPALSTDDAAWARRILSTAGVQE